MEQQCQLAEVSRAGFYRYLQQTAPAQADLLLRARLQELAVAHHRLRGYRMLTALLRREGQVVNHKRVLRLMHEDNLLSLRRKKYVFTTDSRHNCPIYPNLARHMSLTALNQLWVADITFIRLRSEFIYLAVILDAYSRRVIGWALDRTLQAELAIGALQMGLSKRNWRAEGLIHHSDRGVQYASGDYTQILEQGEIQISMSRRGNPYDNAREERFMRTLKEEEVHGTDYRNMEDARSRIGEFLEQVYNRQRLHSALRYLTPEEFEQASEAMGSAVLLEVVENQTQVYHRSHRPWKSLRDSHTPHGSTAAYLKNDEYKTLKCPQLTELSVSQPRGAVHTGYSAISISA